MENVADKMSRVLKELSLKQVELAKELGVHPASISDYITGKALSISGPIVELLSLKYGINKDWLHGKSEDIFNSEKGKTFRPMYALHQKVYYFDIEISPIEFDIKIGEIIAIRMGGHKRIEYLIDTGVRVKEKFVADTLDKLKPVMRKLFLDKVNYYKNALEWLKNKES